MSRPAVASDGGEASGGRVGPAPRRGRRVLADTVRVRAPGPIKLDEERRRRRRGVAAEGSWIIVP